MSSMKRIPIREEGLVGTLFFLNSPSSVVIVLGGSSGGIPEARAEQLAKQGFATLALAYFGAENLPSSLNRIPIEYFQTAIRFLQTKWNVERVALWGGSRGAELALILGTLFPDQIQAIAALVPSSAVYGALHTQSDPAWVFHGKPIAPNAPFLLAGTHSGDSPDCPIAVAPCFIDAMKDQKAFQASTIPVEKIQCPLLLISAEDDQMWPSTLFAKQIIERLIEYKSPIDYSHISYPGVGHAPSRGEVGFHPIFQRWFAYGGSPKSNLDATEDWLLQTISFFNEYFCKVTA